jgi:hypothetical protein
MPKVLTARMTDDEIAKNKSVRRKKTDSTDRRDQ